MYVVEFKVISKKAMSDIVKRNKSGLSISPCCFEMLLQGVEIPDCYKCSYKYILDNVINNCVYRGKLVK